MMLNKKITSVRKRLGKGRYSQGRNESLSWGYLCFKTFANFWRKTLPKRKLHIGSYKNGAHFFVAPIPLIKN